VYDMKTLWVRGKLHVFIASALGGVGEQLHAPASLPSWQEIPVPIQEAGSAAEIVWTSGEAICG
jgi:hypothetical protein